MEQVGALISVLVLSVLTGFWSFMQRRDAQEVKTHSVAKETIGMLTSEIESLKRQMIDVQNELRDCRIARADLAKENMDLMRRILLNGG